MDIPTTISFSKKARDTFQTIKNRTEVPFSIQSRIAIMLAINSGDSLDGAANADSKVKPLPRDLVFGELLQDFDILLRQYKYELNVELSTGKLITALIDIGAHKMAHCRSLEQLADLA